MERYVYEGWVILALLFLFVILLIRIIIGTLRRRPTEVEDAEELPEPELIHARVMRKAVYDKNSGGKVSAYLVRFAVTFLCEDGCEVEYDMTQEQFDAIEEGESGLLMTVNGSFIDFGGGVNAESEE